MPKPGTGNIGTIMFTALAIFAATTFNVQDYGAVGDGMTLNTVAIQKTIDEAAKLGGKVEIPAGKFLTGTLHLRSNVELHLDQDAVLLGSSKRKDYEKVVWHCLLSADKIHDIKITGEGTIDGQGAELAKDVLHMVATGEVKIPPKGWRPSELDRPEIIEMNSCKNVDVTGVTIKNSCCWVQTYRDCENLFINEVKVESRAYWNNDGIDILDCKKVKIFFSDFNCGDDGICLKSDRANSRCEDVAISNCNIVSSASAIKFGTSSHGGFKDVTIRDCTVRDTFRSVVAIESVDGATIENIDIGNVVAKHTGNAFFVRLGHRNLKAPVGRVRNIFLHDFDVEVPAGRPDMGYAFKGPQFSEPHNIEPSSIVGHKEFPIENVRLERIKIRYPGGGSQAIANVPVTNLSKVPERAEEYPEFTMFGELPAWALYARHVNGLTIRDFIVTRDQADYRPAFVLDDVSNATGLGIKVSGDLNPTVVTRSTKKIAFPKKIRSVKGQ